MHSHLVIQMPHQAHKIKFSRNFSIDSRQTASRSSIFSNPSGVSSPRKKQRLEVVSLEKKNNSSLIFHVQNQSPKKKGIFNFFKCTNVQKNPENIEAYCQSPTRKKIRRNNAPRLFQMPLSQSFNQISIQNIQAQTLWAPNSPINQLMDL